MILELIAVLTILMVLVVLRHSHGVAGLIIGLGAIALVLNRGV